MPYCSLCVYCEFKFVKAIGIDVLGKYWCKKEDKILKSTESQVGCQSYFPKDRLLNYWGCKDVRHKVTAVLYLK